MAWIWAAQLSFTEKVKSVLIVRFY